MAHVAEGTLRRLVDEPLAVPDSAAAHVASCVRCARRQAAADADAALARTRLSPLLAAPDVDAAWHRLRAAAGPAGAGVPERPVRPPRRSTAPGLTRLSWRLLAPRRPSPALLLFLAVLLAGAGLGTALTLALGSSAPAPAASASTTADFEAMADVTGLANASGVLGGLHTASGSLRLTFGVLRWSSASPARRVASIGAAEAATGLTLPVPRLPAGVSGPATIVVQPAVTATIAFGSGAPAALRGTSLTVIAGPAVAVEYGSRFGTLGVPTLATFAMRRPALSAGTGSPGTGSSGTASPDRLAAYVLAQRGVPAGVVQELRLVSGVGTVFPAGVTGEPDVSQVDVDGAPGILVTVGSGVASGVIWEDHAGTVRAVLGLLDQRDVLDVADQLG